MTKRDKAHIMRLVKQIDTKTAKVDTGVDSLAFGVREIESGIDAVSQYV